MDTPNGVECRYYDFKDFNDTYLGFTKYLSVLHINIRSMRNKHDSIYELLEHTKCRFDVLFVSETWLSEHESPVQLQNYVCYLRNRTVGRGGGVAAYIRDSIKHEVVPEFSLVNQNVECLLIHSNLGSAAVVYRPPCGSKTCFFFLLWKTSYYT